jgi:phosphoenolpyruvate-protein kinase (PTS system EI component)
VADFLSIGTNDLTASTLGADRFGAGDAPAHHPLVLRAIARSVTAAHRAGVTIEVCGEAASEPTALPLLVGLGVDEVSVGAARVGTVRHWIRRLGQAKTRRLARAALEMTSAAEVAAAAASYARELESAEPGDAAGERVDGPGRVLAFGA